MKNLKIGTRLYIGFAILIIIILLLGISSYTNTKNSNSNIDKFYHHPYTVETNVIKVQYKVTAIHRSMKDITMAMDEDQILLAKDKVDEYEMEIFTHFDIIYDKFLGDKQLIDNSYNAIKDWKKIRDRVIKLTKENKNEEAGRITREEGAKQVELIEKTMAKLELFAHNKAEEIHTSTIKEVEILINKTIIFLSIAFIIGLLTAYFVTNMIRNPIEKLTSIAEDMSKGSVNIEVDINSKDEIGDLANSFKKIIENIKYKTNCLYRIAAGDLNIMVDVKSDKDILGKSINEMTSKISNYIQNIKKVEENLKISNARYRLAAKSGEIGIWEWNLKNDCIIWDESMCNLYNIKKDEFDGSYNCWKKMIYEEDIHKLDEDIRFSICENKELSTQYRVHMPDGNTKFIQSYAHIYIEDNEPKKMIGINLNVTDRIENELKLKNLMIVAEEANKAKSEFLANMSHEIRTPLNAILGFSELLALLTKDIKQQMYLKSIKTAGNSLLILISDILDLSKIEAKMMKIENKPSNLINIIGEIEEIFKMKIIEKGLELDILIDKEMPKILNIDEIRLRQILLNLVGNAIKFTDEGYIKIIVSMEEKSKNGNKINLVVKIKDTGIGISDENQETIFDSFSQQTGQSTRKYGGTGLGLSICKKLTEIMNGKIYLNSVVGSGSEFSIVFYDVSISENSDFIKRTAEIDINNIKFSSSKVLIVDDVESNRIFAREILTLTGIEVVEAENGKEAVVAAKKLTPDLIIMDLVMPGLNGWEAAKIIKEDNDISKIPIIALTASFSKRETENDKNKVFSGYLYKPVDMNRLVNMLIEFLPYKEKEIIKTENYSIKDDIDNLDLSKIDDIDNLRILIAEEIIPISNYINKFVKSSDLKKLKDIINKINTKFDLEVLKKLSDEYNNYSENFDIDNVKRILVYFENILKKLENFNYKE